MNESIFEAEILETKKRTPARHNDRRNIRNCLHKNSTTLFSLLGVLVGIILGFVLVKLEVNSSVIELIEIPGDLFMRAIYLLIAPLVVTSIVSGIIESTPKLLKSVGLFLFVYCISTTLLSGVTGIGLFFVAASITQTNLNSTISNLDSNIQDTFMDIIRNIVPSNFVRMFFQVSKTVYFGNYDLNQTNHSKSIAYVDNANMCGLIFFSVFFGIVVMKAGEKVEPVKALVLSTNHVIMEMLRVIMMTCPLAIVFLIGGSMGRSSENMKMFEGIVVVSTIYVIGLFIHCVGTMNIIYYIFVRKNPFVFMLGMKQAFITGWATMSSAATLPTTIHCMEENNKMDRSLTRVMLPIAATINMDGGCMMITTAILYLAKACNVPITIGRIIIVLIMGAVGSIGGAAVPGAMYVVMIMVCTAVNIPTEFLPMFLALEFILDRFRTACNIYGDCIGVAVVTSLRLRKRSAI